MEFQKIQITRQGTLNATYKNNDGDIIQFNGANIVHKDLKQAMQALIPHLAIITEQREAHDKTLVDLKAVSITDEGDNIYKRMNIDGVTFGSGEQRVSVSGTRILTKQGVISVSSPSIELADNEQYEWNDELAEDIEAVKYEAKEYIDSRKWGVKQSEIDFADIQPFEGVQADEAPVAETQPKKRGRKAKKVA